MTSDAAVPEGFDSEDEKIARDMLEDISMLEAQSGVGTSDAIRALVMKIARDPLKTLSNAMFFLTVVFEFHRRRRGLHAIENGMASALDTLNDMLHKKVPEHPIVKWRSLEEARREAEEIDD